MACSPGLSPPAPHADEVPPAPETPGLPPSTVVPPLAPELPPPSPPAPPRALPCPPTPPPPPPSPPTRTRSDKAQVSAAQPPAPRRTSDEPPPPDPLPPMPNAVPPSAPLASPGPPDVPPLEPPKPPSAPDPPEGPFIMPPDRLAAVPSTPLPATSTWNTCPEVRLDKIPSAWPPLPPGRPVISPAGEPPCAASPAMNAVWTPSRGLADDYRGCSRAEVGTRLCGRGHRESTQVIIQTPDNATQGHR